MTRRSNAEIDTETIIIEAQLNILRKRDRELQKIINDMQQLIDSISAEKLSLEIRSKVLEAERYPINWLPPELLVHVFLSLVEDGKDEQAHIGAVARQSIPVTISHVCQHWRNIALSTPRLWSRLAYPSASWNEQLRHLFIERSAGAPLDIAYSSSQGASVYGDNQRISRLFDDLDCHLERLGAITLECSSPEAIQKVVNILNNSHYKFPHLKSLNLSITQINSTFTNARSLLTNNAHEVIEGQQTLEIPSWCNLKRLKLQEVPLFNVPIHFLANLTTLMLTFHRKKSTANQVGGYQLQLTSLCHFLSLTPRLEDLILLNCAPSLDAILQEDGSSSVEPSKLIRSRLRLNYLKKFDWSYPYASDAHYVMTFFDMPSLEKMDWWVSKHSSNIVNAHEYHGTSPSVLKLPRILELISLRELSLQCAYEDSISSVLRKFTFPSIEKLEIINTDPDVRARGVPPITLPRFESIFRDPRLPHLTHLALSHFNISSEHGREALLGYMPVLTSLALDTCTGVRTLMDGLGAKAVSTQRLASGQVRSRRGIRVCPRLEALSLWSCGNVNINDLRAVVEARSRGLDGEADQVYADGTPHGTSPGVTSDRSKGNEDGNTEEVHMGRKIKPLRKPRRQGQAVVKQGINSASPSAVLTPSTNILSSITAMEEAFWPANIIYLRIEDCPSITYSDALTLKELGVVDVVYKSAGRSS